MSLEQLNLFGLEDIQPVRLPDGVRELTIQQRFEAFHALNPWVMRHLENLVQDAIDRGFQRIGIGMLFELLRYRYGEATRGDEFRLNNDYRSRYVRKLISSRPDWADFFEIRALRAA
ncbi:hypothetical protein ACFXPW_11735 [Streptomyces goshikiensis]|uniref:hypothetical protein n=1 Tax=Streptomyces goshikiensis TaxID=1942 RepID=UPI0036CA3674